MTCSEARDALVVADLRELSRTNDDLSAHLDECGECRARVNAIAAQTATLASVIRLRSRRRRLHRLMLATMAPLAAALVLAIALHGRGAPAAEIRVSSIPVARQVSVTVPQGQAATVVRTADTTVTVVWFTGAGQ